MLNKEKLESFFVELNLSYEEKKNNFWVVFGEYKGLENLVIMLEDPIIIIRVKVMYIPKENQ